MKTARELLFQRHRAVEPKLDAIRQAVLADESARLTNRLTPHPSPLPVEGRGRIDAWREIILSLRWHLAGLSAAWLVVALLSIDSSPSIGHGAVAQKPQPPKEFLAEVRENRRQISQLAESMGDVEPAALPQPAVPQRRSEAQSLIAVV